MLYSIVNMKLRDEYPSFGELCASLGWDGTDIETRLRDAGFEYDASRNQFR